jgi:hypothetical protein
MGGTMFRTALLCAASLIVSAGAVPTLAASIGLPTATLPTATFPTALPDPSSSAALPASITTSNGTPIDVAPLVKDVGQIANATLGGAVIAQNSGDLGAAIPLSGEAPLDAAGLGNTRGGSTTNLTFEGAITNQDLSAVNTGNAITAASVTTGAVGIGANAFSGFNGIGNFLMNSGNQNNIQGSLSVSVVIPSMPAH